MSLHNLKAGLYPILDAGWFARTGLFPENDDASAIDLCNSLAELSIDVVQLRCKANGRLQHAFARRWMALLRRYAPLVRVVINDRVDLALALQADGVHVGQDDLPPQVCRALMGPKALVGFSTHTPEEIAEAQGLEIDYIGFGPVFGTATKPDAESIRGLEALARACKQSHHPVVAIGGIGLHNLAHVQQAGAVSAAVISALFPAEGWQTALQKGAKACPSDHVPLQT